MDPHKQPPQGLKIIFKELRSLKDTSDPLMDAFQVVDFGSGTPTAPAESSSVLDKVFDSSDPKSIPSEPVVLRGTPLEYTIEDVPGVTIFPGVIPPSTQRILLDTLLHRDLSNPKHQTNLHLHYDVSYPDHGRSFFTTSKSDILFKPKDPSIHKSLDLKQVLQKKMRWLTLGGQYDWTNKVYPPEPPPKFPVDVGNLIRSLFNGILDPQAAIVNIYSPGDTLSLHRDVSEKVNQPLASISLGCECLFLIAVEDDTVDPGFKHAVIRLRSGDALLMMREARFAWHGVPKIFPGTCPSHLSSWPKDVNIDAPLGQWDGWMENKRINLNVRQMH